MNMCYLATYLTPYRRYHKVTGVVAIINQPIEGNNMYEKSACQLQHILLDDATGNSRECCLRHLDARTIQILPQTRIKLCQPPILEIGNALLLVPNIASSDFVGWTRHIGGCSCSSVGERKGRRWEEVTQFARFTQFEQERQRRLGGMTIQCRMI